MIRAATEADVDAIAHVHVAAWRETYPGIMPQEIPGPTRRGPGGRTSGGAGSRQAGRCVRL